MTARDTEALLSFYEKLGFPRDPARRAAIWQGFTIVAFMDFQPEPCINFRGPSITETGLELARRGYSLHHGFAPTEQVRGDGTGGFFVYDPDGHRMFFNTHAPERPSYDAWKDGTLGPDEGSLRDRNEMSAPETLPLGDLVICLDVTDLAASVSFYLGMGFKVAAQSPASATLSSRPARANRYYFPVRLRQADEPRYSFGFLCADVEGVCAEIERRGVEIITTEDGPAFVDPDGNRVTLLPALP
jgi:catechol 2,3-dioxygenase-like lactoylglutathione lyase family enzyme